MMVTCVTADLRDVSPNPVAYNRLATAHVTPGAAYPVFAMSIYAGELMMLLRDDTGLPNWYPMPLFTVTDHELPPDWRFASYDTPDHLQALWGYREMVDDEAHYDALLARDTDALAVFFRRRS